ncbi:helix-turn-helix transcriptional regulator [Streptomyces sp. AC563]|uniref:helix-turn-helix domain-containing protein n=1 Tax=Streptomyces buecherae TaxID=2763006 RepID=UPI00164CE662|nr:helix-turn-helix transcriptional regulator [Streptomyces buecherae]MBC3989319.1 helix-turn-helix transcriptional regulator [Streptomyces buecherae]
MSTNYQAARVALGARLKELRVEGGLSGKRLAHLTGWQPSKVSRLEHGKQTPKLDDLRAWTEAVGMPAALGELEARLRSLETHYASWRRQLAAGTRARQEAWQATEAAALTVCNFESAVIPGLLQTADYARHMFIRTTELHHTVADIEDGVNARMRRQQALYETGRQFRFLIWEPALRMLFCPPSVMAGQLDRLTGVIGLASAELGIVPLGVDLPVVPTHGFWLYDDRLVMVETIGAELRLVDSAEVELYSRVWDRLSGAALFGQDARRVITRARNALGVG